MDPTWTVAYHNSTNRRTFAWVVVKKMFALDELRGRNCSCISNVDGKQKLPLDPAKLLHVRTLAFNYYPLQVYEREKKAWGACCRTIDSNLRSKFKSKPNKAKDGSEQS